MPEAEPSPAAPRVDVLAAAAVEPALRSILCLDTAPAAVLATARRLADMLAATDGREVHTIYLGSHDSEEDLWDGIAWVRDRDGIRPEPIAGPLVPSQSQTTKLVVIPDLARLALAAARACVALMDAEVAHLERHGQSLTWCPTGTAWIAGCARASVGCVSPHLLDRFALRLQVPVERRDERETRVRRILDGGGSSHASEPAVDPSVIAAISRASQLMSTLGGEAVDAVLDASPGAAPGFRRDIALGRLAVATARLAGATEVTAEHVTAAAETLRAVRPPPPRAPGEDLGPASSVGETAPGADHEDSATDAETTGAPGGEHDVFASGSAEALEPADVDVAAVPPIQTSAYPEDHAVIDRDVEPLRTPPVGRGRAATTGGVPVGVQRAVRLIDLALTSTVVEALKWQPVRHRMAPGGDARTLILSRTDLRSYRRAPLAREMLALVLDYTCRAAWSWPEALRQYLRWAYTHRASVCLVRVGAADAECELRADRVLARNMLDPRLPLALEVPGGSATPLAHGLELALQSLRHALHHRRAGVAAAQLVIVTDGRGNVSLRDARQGRVGGAVGAEGIADSIAVAEQIAALDRIDVTLIDPEPAVLADLPLRLSAALGAEVVPLRAVLPAGAAVAA